MEFGGRAGWPIGKVSVRIDTVDPDPWGGELAPQAQRQVERHACRTIAAFRKDVAGFF